MFNIRTTSTILFILVFPMICWAAANQDQKTLKEKMLQDLDVIKNTFEVKYAPFEWKKLFANWDLQEKIYQAKASILSKNPVTLKDYKKVVKTFFNSARDYHVGVHFFSTESAFLPFRVQGAEGKYFISWVDHRIAPKSLISGDEILQFDGQPIHQVITQLKNQELGNPESQTDQGLAEMLLTNRLGILGHDVPHGPITIRIKHAKSGKTTLYKFKWDYTPESISPGPFSLARSASKPTAPALVNSAEYNFFSKEMAAAFYSPMRQAFKNTFKGKEQEDDRAMMMGNKNGCFPALGEIIWTAPTDATFYAYLFLTPSQKVIGYVRIPDYYKGVQEALEFVSIINHFEKESDLLIIDQLNNPGGELFFMYAITSMLASDVPLQVPMESMTITQKDVFFAHNKLQMQVESEDDVIEMPLDDEEDNKTGNTLYGFPITEKLQRSSSDYFRFIIHEWDSGRSFTQPTYLYGIKDLSPHPWGHYTKPIVVLINHMDFSCADFLPAILQDNKRATIFGSKTAGAGGFVLNHNYPNLFGIAGFTYTASIAERMDRNPIENLGVSPDVCYEVTATDLQTGYSGYIRKLYETIDQILQ